MTAWSSGMTSGLFWIELIYFDDESKITMHHHVGWPRKTYLTVTTKDLQRVCTNSYLADPLNSFSQDCATSPVFGYISILVPTIVWGTYGAAYMLTEWYAQMQCSAMVILSHRLGDLYVAWQKKYSIFLSSGNIQQMAGLADDRGGSLFKTMHEMKSFEQYVEHTSWLARGEHSS